ncbi:MAG: 4-hydroxy-3-methylbut-2-enyl diphosphate reductase [Candidatus Cloacimonetes bacterium]|nr:4-hydroxy-3-methylbut-2-enyl diphosphate reductase [Candidatus Cloacimonadota bacterium]
MYKKQMIIRLARNSGFCFGVKRAINIAQETAGKFKNAVTLGPIIHNPQMVNRLKADGVGYVDSVDEIVDEAVIIRSHGITKETSEELSELNIPIIDATCPYVSKTQMVGRKLSEEGYDVIILGDYRHPEVIALQSYVPGNVIVIDEDSDLSDKSFNKAGLICQTTQSLEKLVKVVGMLIPISKELRIINTICNATNVRQESTAKLAKNSELMFVIGGKNSSNTKMLARISSQYCKTVHIETADEIDRIFIKDLQRIGLTAGASTPDWIILEVYNKIIEISESNLPRAINIEDISAY